MADGVAPAWHRFIPPLAVLVVAVGLYANTVQNGFTWDDKWLIVHNDRLGAPGYAHYLLFESEQLWRTLKRLSFVLDSAIWGKDNASGFHVTNIAFHVVTCLLLYAVGTRLGLRRIGAFAAALLFAAHPAHVEAVANISHRKEPMTLLFCLAALLSWRAARASAYPWAPLSAIAGKLSPPTHDRHTRLELVGWAGAFYLTAMLSKEAAAVMLPVAICGHELLFRHQLAASVEQKAVRRNRIAAVLLVVAVLALFTQHGYLGKLHTRYTPENIAWMTLDKTTEWTVVPPLVAKAYGFYGGLMVWPQPLYADRAFVLPEGLLEPGVLLGGFTIVLLTVAVLALRKRSPVAGFGLLFFGVMLLPLTNVVPLTFWLVAERFAYVPSAGIALSCGAAFDRGWIARPRVASALLALILISLGVTTVRQNRVWQDDRSLWQNTVQYNPDSWIAHHGVAIFQAEDGLVAAAEQSYRRSIELNPRYADPHHGLARLLLGQGRYEEAITHAQIHADAAVNNTDSLLIIGNAHFSQQHYAEALAAYAKATTRSIDPDEPALRFNHANTLLFLGRIPDALARLGGQYRDGDGFQAVLLRGILLQQVGRIDDAVASYRRAEEMQPNTPGLRQQIDALLGQQ